MSRLATMILVIVLMLAGVWLWESRGHMPLLAGAPSVPAPASPAPLAPPSPALPAQAADAAGEAADAAADAAAIAADVAAGKLRAEKINEKLFARYLDEPAIPDVDLFVRSSGEQRLSNFLLWQGAYAEYSFPATAWPDFTADHLATAIDVFQSRQRRFGHAEVPLTAIS